MFNIEGIPYERVPVNRGFTVNRFEDSKDNEKLKNCRAPYRFQCYSMKREFFLKA